MSEDLCALRRLTMEHYRIEVQQIALLDAHFGTEIYVLQAVDGGKYILKQLPVQWGNMESEGRISEFLSACGIPVPKLLRTRGGAYSVTNGETHFHVRPFIEGETPELNSAPDWLLRKSAQMLGRIHSALKDWEPLHSRFPRDEDVRDKMGALWHQLHSETDPADKSTRGEIKEQLMHGVKILEVPTEEDGLTLGNVHGDYYIGQLIVDGEDVAVIDWASACAMPTCVEVILSYAFAAPSCKAGRIDAEGLREYIRQYAEFAALNPRDVAMMPHLLYRQLYLTNYAPPFADVPEGYRPISGLINRLLNWLHDHADALSADLLG